MTDTPLTNQQLDLDAIEARANAATDGPWTLHEDDGDTFRAPAWEVRPASGEMVARLRDWASADAEFIAHARTDVPALLAEVRRLRAVVAACATLAERWEQMADHGDTAIGSFEGPAAVTLDAEVGERGRTYRNASRDVREVLSTGQIPDDLLTATERAAAVPAVETGR